MATLLQALFLDVAIALGSHHLFFRPYEPTSYGTIFLTTTTVTLPVVYLILPFVSTILRAFLLTHVIYFISLLLSVVAYRLSPFHPLSDIPGPVLCKVSKLWPTYIAYRGDTHKYHKWVHERYGLVVRIGPNEISVIDKALFPAILGHNGMPKGPVWDARRLLTSRKLRGHRSLNTVRDLKLHAELRRPWNKAFSKEARVDYEEFLLVQASELLGHLRKLSSGTRKRMPVEVNLARWMGLFAFDFMGKMAFGGTYNLMKDHTSFGGWDIMESSFEFPGIATNIPWIAPLTRFLPWLMKPTAEFNKFAFAQATKRAQSDPPQRDLFYHLINSTEEGSESTPLSLIMHNAILAIVAGSDAISTTLDNTIYHLLRYPEWMGRLRDEIDQASEELPPGSIPPPAKMDQLKFLNAIINETLRLLPPVLTQLQRAPAEGSGGRFLGSFFIPEGTAVQVPPYVAHRHPSYFSPGPDQFRPQRFLPATNKTGIDTEEEEEIVDTSAFIPFSLGPANCVGRHLAITELCYMLSLLVRNFDMEFAEGYDPERWENGLKDRFVTVKGGLPVRLTLRDGIVP